MTRRAAVFVVVFVAATSGCSKPTSTFHGKVSIQGKPLTSGVIFFLGPAPKMQMGMGTIHEDGNYTATDVPVGEVRVAFQAPDIPVKYRDVNKSDLIYTITSGMTSLDIIVP
jgi:hypothetical protein